MVTLSAFKTGVFGEFWLWGRYIGRFWPQKIKLKKGERKGCYRWALEKETDTKMASTVALQVHITGKTTGFPHLVLLHLTLFALRVGFAGGWLTKKRPKYRRKEDGVFRLVFHCHWVSGRWSCAWVSAARVLGWVSGECGRQGKTLTEGGSCVGLAGAPPRAPCSHALLVPAAKG